MSKYLTSRCRHFGQLDVNNIDTNNNQRKIPKNNMKIDKKQNEKPTASNVTEITSTVIRFDRHLSIHQGQFLKPQQLPVIQF